MPSACALDSGNTWSCRLTRSGGYEGLVVWNSSRNVSYKVSAEYTEVRDLRGNVSEVAGGSVQVGNSPVLIENGKVF